MRTFIAIELPKEIRENLTQLQERLKALSLDVKWVSQENIHLTLKFIGESDEKKVDRTKEILEEVARENTCFTATLSSICVFPDVKFPRIIWVGIGQGDEKIKAIVKNLEDKIAKLGIPKEERPFLSHITIGRIKSPKNKDRLIQEIENLGQEFINSTFSFAVNKITLFKSTLKPQGPIYEILKEASLKTT